MYHLPLWNASVFLSQSEDQFYSFYSVLNDESTGLRSKIGRDRGFKSERT